MITAYDPFNFLSIIDKEHIKSSDPVARFNFLPRFQPGLDAFDLPWLAWDGEVILDHNIFWKTQRKPTAIFATHIPSIPDPLPIPRIFYPHHFLKTIKTNQKLGRIRPISDNKNRPFLADMLFGQPRYHRWIFLEYAKSHGLIDRCLVNFMDGKFEKMDRIRNVAAGWPNFSKPATFRSPALSDYDEQPINDFISANQNDEFDSITVLPEYGEWTSQILPNKIYDASYVSIVTETATDEGVFLTEKTAKPLLAGRIFIGIGQQGFLREIRKLGFATFGDLFDESYDDYPLIHERILKAVELLSELSRTDMDALYEKARPMLYHNQQLMLSGHLTARAHGFIEGLAA